MCGEGPCVEERVERWGCGGECEGGGGLDSVTILDNKAFFFTTEILKPVNLNS